MGFVREARRDAEALVRSLREARGITPGSPGRASSGVDRATSLALGQIQRNTERIMRDLDPSAADERSLLL